MASLKCHILVTVEQALALYLSLVTRPPAIVYWVSCFN